MIRAKGRVRDMKLKLCGILLSLFLHQCSNSLVSSEDQKCRDLYKRSHQATPQQTCLDLLGTATALGGRQSVMNPALFTCYLYLEKWKSCADESPIKPVIVNTL